MRNPNYLDDQKVFAFINDASLCYTYSHFTDFLFQNNLPLLERWAFYYLGKHWPIDNETILRMADRDYTAYGGYIHGDIYYWKRYLENEDNEKEGIREELKGSNTAEDLEKVLQKIFIERGWNYVCEMERSDYQCDADRMEQENFDNHPYFESDESSYCEACQESPCQCSDMEKTSTTWN